MKICYRNKISAFLAALIFVSLSTVSFAQKTDNFDRYLYLQPNIGITQYFGDLNSHNLYNANPKFGWGGLAGYQFTPVFGLRTQFMQSNLYGENLSMGQSFTAKTWDLSLQGTINVVQLFSSSYNPDRLVNVYIFGGMGYIHENTTVKSTSTLLALRSAKNDGLVFPGGLGVSFRLTDNIALNLEYGHHITGRDSELDLTAYNVPGNKSKFDQFSYVSAGLTFKIGRKDTDHDGVPDKFDRCPTQAGPKALQGCPDKDGDGIADIDDRCPDQAGPKELKGCPDRDGDGIADIDDRCPDQAGPKELKGCPDRDGDGVPDIDDLCPDQPGPASNHGCPIVEKKEIQIYKVVYFNFDKSVVITKYTKDLDEVADIMKANTDVKVTVKGYADGIGTQSYNLRLSEKRANYVMRYLEKKGVEKSRMIESFFGKKFPAATNKTAEGRALNRRVEIQNVK